MSKNKNLLTKKEKAQELGISYRTLDRWVKSEKIKYFMVNKSKRKWFIPKEENA